MCMVHSRPSQQPKRRQPLLRNNQPKLVLNWPLKSRHWRSHQKQLYPPRTRRPPPLLCMHVKCKRRWSKVHSEHVHAKCVPVLHSVVQRHWLCHGIQDFPASRCQPEIGKCLINIFQIDVRKMCARPITLHRAQCLRPDILLEKCPRLFNLTLWKNFWIIDSNILNLPFLDLPYWSTFIST